MNADNKLEGSSARRALLKASLSLVLIAGGLLAQPVTAEQRLQVEHEQYTLPSLALRDEQGQAFDFAELGNEPKPLLLNFIFTSCSAICPTLSSGLLNTLAALREAGIEARAVSITIDPLNDTPRTLRHYKKKFGSPSDWTLLTGDLDDIRTAQRAFGAYRGNKMNHAPLTFLRPARDASWLRVSGFATAKELSDLLRMQLAGAQ